MKSRHRAREIALQFLYQHDLATHSESKEVIKPATPGSLDLNRVRRDLSLHLQHFIVPDTLHEFIAFLVCGTLAKLSELDQLLEKHASHWKVARMSSVDRCVLRMAAFEMKNSPDATGATPAVPASVVIDEAIELAKEFGTADSPAFINGILDSIRQSS